MPMLKRSLIIIILWYTTIHLIIPKIYYLQLFTDMVNRVLGNFYVHVASLIYLGKGDDVFIGYYGYCSALCLNYSPGVFIAGKCTAYHVILLIIMTVVFLPVQNKTSHILKGVFILILLNIFRIISLAYLAQTYPQYLEFNHKYTFNILIYVYYLIFYVNLTSSKLNTTSGLQKS